MKIMLLGDRVLIKPLEKEQKGVIIVPDNAKERPVSGIIVDVGPGKIEFGKVINTIVEKGDEVLYTGYSGVEVTLEGEKYLLMRESDLYGIVSEKNERIVIDGFDYSVVSKRIKTGG